MPKSRGYLSFLKLYDDFMPLPSYGGKWSATSLKLASLFFDELVMNNPERPGEPSWVLSTVEKEAGVSRDTLAELERIWLPITNYLPENEFFNPKAWVEADRTIVGAAKKVTEKETKKNLGYLEPHEVAWAGAALISSIDSWFKLIEKTECCFIPHERECEVLQSLFVASTQRHVFDIFSEVLRCRLPDLATVSWNQIVHLRHSKFLEHFRLKMYELYQLVAKGDNSAKVLADEMIDSDLRQLAMELKPNPVITAVKGIASTVLPAPIAALGTARQILKESSILDKHGWLYFVIEAEKSTK
jgi:hypothetical protein